MNTVKTRWTLPLLSVVSALCILACSSGYGQSQIPNYWSASGTTFSTKGTNFAIAVPDLAGRSACVDQFTITSTDSDDWMIFYETGVEALVTVTNLPAGGGTNLCVSSTNGFAAGDLVLFNSRTGNVWSVMVVGTAALTATNIMVVTNTIGHTAFSTITPRQGDRVYRLVSAGKINLTAPSAGGIATYLGSTNSLAGWQKLTMLGGPYWVGDPGKPLVIGLRDDSPGAAIVAGTCTNEIWSISGGYR